jgi:hypothetical protein
MEQLRERIGLCDAKGSCDGRELNCELIARHHAPGNRPTSHSADGILWMDVPPDDPGDRAEVARVT